MWQLDNEPIFNVAMGQLDNEPIRQLDNEPICQCGDGAIIQCDNFYSSLNKKTVSKRDGVFAYWIAFFFRKQTYPTTIPKKTIGITQSSIGTSFTSSGKVSCACSEKVTNTKAILYIIFAVFFILLIVVILQSILLVLFFLLW